MLSVNAADQIAALGTSTRGRRAPTARSAGGRSPPPSSCAAARRCRVVRPPRSPASVRTSSRSCCELVGELHGDTRRRLAGEHRHRAVAGRPSAGASASIERESAASSVARTLASSTATCAVAGTVVVASRRCARRPAAAVAADRAGCSPGGRCSRRSRACWRAAPPTPRRPWRSRRDRRPCRSRPTGATAGSPRRLAARRSSATRRGS